MTKSVLKWAGSKAKGTPLIRQQLPSAKCLIEPFVGSAAASLAWEFDEYVLLVSWHGMNVGFQAA